MQTVLQNPLTDMTFVALSMQNRLVVWNQWLHMIILLSVFISGFYIKSNVSYWIESAPLTV